MGGMIVIHYVILFGSTLFRQNVKKNIYMVITGSSGSLAGFTLDEIHYFMHGTEIAADHLFFTDLHVEFLFHK